MARLSSKTALVTGASRGIGAAIARRLAAEGATVIGTVNQSTESADTLAKESNIRFVSVDLSRPDAADVLAAQVEGPIDILVNNAGIASFIAWGDNTADTIDREFAVNVRAPILLTQALGPRITEGGRIIFLGSIVADRGFGDGAIATYAATKGALATLTRQLAGPFGQRGITVNTIAPGAIDTDMSAWIREDGGEAQVQAMQALKRVGVANDIASAVAALVSDDGRWITGQSIHVSGGALV